MQATPLRNDSTQNVQQGMTVKKRMNIEPAPRAAVVYYAADVTHRLFVCLFVCEVQCGGDQ